jgi:hypothetical protein
MATVYIWSSNITNNRPGHASLLLDTGTYISFWPEEGVILIEKGHKDKQWSTKHYAEY